MIVRLMDGPCDGKSLKMERPNYKDETPVVLPQAMTFEQSDDRGEFIVSHYRLFRVTSEDAEYRIDLSK